MPQLDEEIEVKNKVFYKGDKKTSFQSVTSFIHNDRVVIYHPEGMLRASAGNGLAPLTIHQIKPQIFNPWWSYHIVTRNMKRDDAGYYQYRFQYTCLISENPYTNQSFIDKPMQVHPGMLDRYGKDTMTFSVQRPQTLAAMYARLSSANRIVRGLREHAGLEINRTELEQEVLMDGDKYKDLPTAIPRSYIEKHHDNISIAHLISDIM